MTTLREAATLALEALEGRAVNRYMERLEETITALRTALSEPERDWSLLEATQESLREHMAEIKQLRDKLQRPEPEQEPVAWIEAPHGKIKMNPFYKMTAPPQSLPWSIPLYPHPPTDDTALLRQCLTVLELEEMACRYEKEPTPEHIAQVITALRERLKEST